MLSPFRGTLTSPGRPVAPTPRRSSSDVASIRGRFPARCDGSPAAVLQVGTAGSEGESLGEGALIRERSGSEFFSVISLAEVEVEAGTTPRPDILDARLSALRFVGFGSKPMDELGSEGDELALPGAAGPGVGRIKAGRAGSPSKL